MKKHTKAVIIIIFTLFFFSSCDELENLGFFGQDCAISGCKNKAQDGDFYCSGHRKIIDKESRPRTAQ
ncbi:MAG: hypothetical protein GX963_06240 [Bacteroidales bacterium]|nr:hypothetical protein [Bacteroidales bacterium]